jgi:hypothetical protein
MNDKLSEVQSKIASLWSKYLDAKDFKNDLEKYLNESKDWHHTNLTIENNKIYLQLYTSKDDGYDFTVKMTKK